MFHSKLRYQIQQHLKNEESEKRSLTNLLDSVSETYFEHDIPEGEEVFRSVSENGILQTIVQKNPNPVLQIQLNGIILFKNPAATAMGHYINEDRVCTCEDYFKSILNKLDSSGEFEVITEKGYFRFQYEKFEREKCFIFYGLDISDKKMLQRKAYDNFYRLNNFIELTNDAFYIIYENKKGKNYFSPQWGLFFGFNPSSTLKVLNDRKKIVTRDTLSVYENALLSLQSTSKVKVQYSVRNKLTGEVFWLDELMTRQYDPVTDDTIISGRITDVTKEHIYSLQVRESEERFKLMIEGIPIMVWVTDKNNKLIFTNRATKEFLGMALEEMNDFSDFLQFVHPEDKEKTTYSWTSQLKRKKVIDTDYRVKDKKGEYHHIQEKTVARFLDDGSFAGYIGAYFDMTKEKLFQFTLQNEKEKLETIYRHSPDIIFLINQRGLIEFVSPSVKRILGYAPVSMENRKIEDFIGKQYSDNLRTDLLSTEKNVKKRSFEYEMIKNNGTSLWVETIFSDLKTGDKSANKRLLYSRDISSFKSAEVVLKQNEQNYRSLFEKMQLGVVELDTNQKISWINNAFTKMTGYDLSDLQNRSLSEFVTDKASSIKVGKGSVKKRMPKKDITLLETSVRVKDSNYIDVVVSSTSTMNLYGKINGSVRIFWDVSRIREMERQIAHENLTRQHQIMEARLNEEEKQKQILGYELHDNVGQMLTYLNLFLQLEGSSVKNDPMVFEKAQQKIIEILNEVRRLSRILVPPALNELGLKEALIEFLNQYSGIKNIQFTLLANEKVFSGFLYDAQIMIYRIIQELTNNTLKHAAASSVKVSFLRSKDKLIILYADNGIGFDQRKIKEGIGLKSIKTRVVYYGGELILKSYKKQGTEYTIEFPINNLLKI